jgi:hydroxypyruvate isomerase
VPPRFAANVSILFTERPFVERFAAAAAAGFGAVEFWWPEEPLDAVESAIAAAELEVVLVNFDGGSVVVGERGFVNDPAREARWRSHVPVALSFARRIGCGRMNALVGLSLPGVSRDEQLVRAAANVRFAARAAAPMSVLIEAINTVDHGPYLLSNTADAAAVVRAVGEPNVFLQYDVFHMARMGEDVEAALREHIDLIAHVQIADLPGRGEPGSGSLDFPALYALLDELGYDGWVSAEYWPTTPSTEASLAGWFSGVR